MDKETLLKFAQPAATFALAMNIFNLQFIAKASGLFQIEASVANYKYPSFGAICLKIND